jgi:hypothetical protein
MSKEQKNQQTHLKVEKAAKLAQALKKNLARRKTVAEKENNNITK